MTNKFCFKALDKILKDTMSDNKSTSKKIFGGKTIVFGGNFLLPRGPRSDIVHANINASYSWDHSMVLRLTKNICLNGGSTSSSPEEVQKISDWMLQIGDGKISELIDGYVELEIPKYA